MSGKKRGLSLEEKRQKMLEFFYEKRDFFQLKELERLCQREKGITSLSVKDVLTSLVDDNMVDSGKVGTSVYFWAFPSKAVQVRRRQIKELTNGLNEINLKITALKEAISASKIGKEDTVERKQLLSILAEKLSVQNELKKQLNDVCRFDPEVFESISKESTSAFNAANRWTDNIFVIKSWLNRKFSVDDSTITKQFGLPEDLDYLEN